MLSVCVVLRVGGDFGGFYMCNSIYCFLMLVNRM